MVKNAKTASATQRKLKDMVPILHSAARCAPPAARTNYCSAQTACIILKVHATLLGRQPIFSLPDSVEPLTARPSLKSSLPY